MLVGVIPRACDVHACRYGTGGRYLGSTCTFFPNDNTVRREDWPLFFFSLIFFYYRLHFAPVYSAGAMVKNAGFTYTRIRQFLHYVASKVIKKTGPHHYYFALTLPHSLASKRPSPSTTSALRHSIVYAVRRRILRIRQNRAMASLIFVRAC